MGFKDLAGKVSKSAKDYSDKRKSEAATREIEKQEAIASENARRSEIIKGNFEPISLSLNLDKEESAYAVFNASRFAITDKVIEKTTGNTKKKGVMGRAVVGGVLLGPLGALGGATTAGSKISTTTTHNVVKVNESIDHGQLILTNKRLLFVGNNNIATISFDSIIAYAFTDTNRSTRKLEIKYPDMLPGEFFKISGPAVYDASYYYEGIMHRFYGKQLNPISPKDSIHIPEPKSQEQSMLKKVGKVYFSPYTMTYKGIKKVSNRKNTQ